MIPEFEELQRQINNEVDRLRDAAGEGNCQSFEAYKHLTGEIQGLLRARLLLQTLAKKAETDDH